MLTPERMLVNLLIEYGKTGGTKMIKISSALKQDEIVELLNAYDSDDLEFNFVKKEGIALYFETNASDLEEAASTAKALIKGEPWGSILYFQSIPA